ncbi:helix-turn-helix domain-containing protein [Paraprevotella clara]|uniref:helix-turn-helix domain-containing protein n=1 Tax=Paraprevotella clara TaxID=454154 RepID=UPI00266DA151|nr:helix-turn-helix domain-containing protein [Paraprevotella clara]
MDRSEVGMRIKSFLKSKKVTQLELSQKIGITQSIISEIISGKRNPLPLVEKICEVYGVSRDYLITGEENKLSDIIANNNIDENGLSHDDKVRLLDKLESLYERHQAILKTISDATKESGDVLKEIAAINKLLIVGTNI